MSEPIFAAVEHDLERGWDAFRDHLPHAHYHDPEAAATPATEAPMSLVSTLEADYEKVKAEVEAFGKDKLGPAAEEAKKIEPILSNKLVDAFLTAAHVPVSAIEGLLIPAINWLSDAYAPETAAPTPADPAMGDQPAAPEPQPAPVA